MVAEIIIITVYSVVLSVCRRRDGILAPQSADDCLVTLSTQSRSVGHAVSWWLGVFTAERISWSGELQWRRYARSWQVLCPATEKIGPDAGTCLWYCNEM